MSNFSERVYVIPGATGSVGGAVTRRLLQGGAKVIAAGRNRERLTALLEAHPNSNGQLLTREVEAGNSDSFQEATQTAVDTFGRLDGMVNCIGSVLLKPAHLTTDEDWSHTMETNLFSAFATVRAAVPHLRKSGGSIVLISSVAAGIGLPNHEAIAAAKAGVAGLTRSAAATYAKAGIRVNAVSPGLVKSEMTRKFWESEAAESASLTMHPLGKLGEPDQIASFIEWLLAPENDWITGQIIGIDGGMSSVARQGK